MYIYIIYNNNIIYIYPNYIYTSWKLHIIPLVSSTFILGYVQEGSFPASHWPSLRSDGHNIRCLRKGSSLMCRCSSWRSYCTLFRTRPRSHWVRHIKQNEWPGLVDPKRFQIRTPTNIQIETYIFQGEKKQPNHIGVQFRIQNPLGDKMSMKLLRR